MSWAERSTGISPTITQFLFAPTFGRIDSIDTDIARHRRADRGARSAPFLWKAILDTRVLIAEDLGAAPAPLVLARVECYTRRSAASRHPSRWRGAATSM